MRKRTTSAGLAAALLACAASASQAALIKPTGVSGTSFYQPAQSYVNLINASGLSAESSAATHDNGSSTIWHGRLGGWSGGSSAAPVVNDQFVTFDLGGVFDISNAYIWNMNQSGVGAARSINQYDLEVSGNGVTWTPVVTNGNLTAGTGVSGLTANNVAFATQTGVRYVRIGADTAHSGLTSEYVGLSEVRFEGTQTSQAARPTAAFAASAAGLPEAVSSTDLIQGLAATSSVSLITGTAPMLTDGVGGAALADRVIPTDGNTLWQLTYNLAAAVNIDEINVFSYNTDDRRRLDFDVEVSTDGINWQYIALGVGNQVGATGSGNISVVNLARLDAAEIALGVTDIRFSFRPTHNGGGSNTARHSALIEIDVIGSVVVPSPAAMPAGLAMLALVAARRRRTTR